jgi:hypothetical protein
MEVFCLRLGRLYTLRDQTETERIYRSQSSLFVTNILRSEYYFLILDGKGRRVEFSSADEI